MSIGQWIIFFLVVQIIHFLGTWKLYVKAGRKAWEAAVPVYNAVVLMQIINRPKWWVILLFIPIINLLMFPVIWVETIRSYGFKENWQTWAAVLSLGFYIMYINYFEDPEYIKDRSLQPRTPLGEWVSSIVFAIVAATFVHTYFIQPYAIPTGSLERTLRIGDFLFVSKYHYGARTPMTTVAAPMVHDTIPGLRVKSYFNKPQLPYFRLPGFQKVKKNDIVVFSWPADTVRQFFKKEKGVKKPIDKKSNYVKRCVGTPGDSLEIIDGLVHVNGKELILSDRAKPMYDYTVYGKNGVSSKMLKEMEAADIEQSLRLGVRSLTDDQFKLIGAYLMGVSRDKNDFIILSTRQGGELIKRLKALNIRVTNEIMLRKRLVNLTYELKDQLKGTKGIDSVVMMNIPKGQYSTNTFPQRSDLYPWNIDNFGPIYIPEEGKSVAITPKTIPFYKKIIRDYEHNTVEVVGNSVLINGKEANTYTFQQDYYWMMGDNRDHSEDSRMWGYVPDNHIVGKPVFLWMSFDNFNDGLFKWRPRWNRIFTTVGGSGEPVSYFWYFIIALAGWFGYDFYRKKKKAAKE